jgi:hypothetical protein
LSQGRVTIRFLPVSLNAARFRPVESALTGHPCATV